MPDTDRSPAGAEPPAGVEPPAGAELMAEVVRIGRSLGAGSGEPAVLSTRHDVLVVRVGDVVVKAHPERTDPGALAIRLRVAADPRFRDILVPPIEPVARVVSGRSVTAWPAGEIVRPDAGNAPWEEAAELLAGLHSMPVAGLPGPLPAGEGISRVTRAVRRMDAEGPADATGPTGPAADVIRRAYATLPGWIREGAEGGGVDPAVDLAGGAAGPAGAEGGHDGDGGLVVVHGDWHLGQLARTPGYGWRLIDIDDLGLGRPFPAAPSVVDLLFGPERRGCGPEWDLARPAALYAGGVLPPDVWDRFLGAYRACRGPAVPPDGDPWGILDTPAKALAIQIAATCVIVAQGENRPLDESETAIVDTCKRIAGARPAP